MTVRYINNFKTVLALGVAQNATTFTLAAGMGTKMPDLSGGGWCWVRLGSDDNNDVVKVTSRAGDVLAGEAVPHSWPAGTTVKITACKELFDDLKAERQPVNALLTAISALLGTVAADKLPYVASVASGVPTMAWATITTQARSFLAAATQTGQRQAMGATTVGESLFTAVNAAAARAAIGAGSGGGDMLKSEDLAGLANVATARTNLGLGTSATRDVGTGSGNVAAGDAPAAAVTAHAGATDPHGDRAYADTGDATTLSEAQSYADGLVMGLLDDRGSYDASSNLWPDGSTATGNLGGSGASHAIMKGDVWTLSVAGTLGGTSYPVGTLIRALTDSPGQTAGNWAVAAVPFGFSPENQANKAAGVASDPTSTTKYPHFAALVAYVAAVCQPVNALLTAIAALSGSGFLKLTSGTPSVASIATADLPANITTYDIPFCCPGIPGADQKFGAFCIVTPCSLPASLTGSQGKSVAANPSADYVVTLYKNGSSIGTVTFNNGASTVSFSFASQVSFAEGDVISAVGQATADGTLNTPTFTLKAAVS